MVDLITLAVVLLIVLVVMLRKTSAGVAVLSLLAGVMLNQLLGNWLINLLPMPTTVNSEYLTVIIHILLTFTPVVSALVAVKVIRQHVLLSLIVSLTLGFLVVFFGLKIIEPLPFITSAANNSGLLTFLDPYQNIILSSSAILAIVEMIMSHHSSHRENKTKHKKG